MGIRKGRSSQTKVVRYNRKHPKSKFCNKRNKKRFQRRMKEIAEILRKLEKSSSTV